MLGKGSKLYSIFRFKCPHCHEGDLYKSSLTSMNGIYNMHEKCTECGQRYELEPGFYWGAMYIGYALSSGYMLIGVSIAIFLMGLSVNQSFALVIILGLFFLPLIARFARSVWINLYIKYDPTAVERYRKKVKE